MPREQELALCAREIMKAESEVMQDCGDIGAYVGLTDWLWELDAVLAEGNARA